MKLIRGVLQGFALGLSPYRLGCRFDRGLSTINPSGFGASGSANSFEPADEFERRIFSDLGNSRGSDSFYQKLDRLGKANDRSGSGSGSIFNDGSRYGLLDDINETLTTLSDGMDGKLKEAASYFEYDLEEVSQDDYKYRPDVTFHTGNTYDIKDLDLTKPGIRKPAKRNEFEVTTEEVLRRADFRNVRFLANFITDAGVIIKRSQTKISAKAQRKVAREIKTARAFGLMPFTTMGTKHFVFGKTMQDLDEDYEYETYDTHNFVDTEAL